MFSREVACSKRSSKWQRVASKLGLTYSSVHSTLRSTHTIVPPGLPYVIICTKLGIYMGVLAGHHASVSRHSQTGSRTESPGPSAHGSETCSALRGKLSSSVVLTAHGWLSKAMRLKVAGEMRTKADSPHGPQQEPLWSSWLLLPG